MKYGENPVVESFLPQTTAGSARVQDADSPTTPLVERIRIGLPFDEFHALHELLEIPEDELGRFLGMSPATLQRRKKSRQLNSAESERIVRFARLFGAALEVFETHEAARSWLKTPNPGTNQEPPLSYADTEFGAREVENLLGRIDHGVF
jgi:putative toxin-antitoxin system antitoxin component (TIGR02293 family)